MALIFEIFLTFLLILAIGYGFILNRRIVALRKDQGKLDKLAKTFTEATSRAESSLAQLKSTGQATLQSLEDSVKIARGLQADLIYLIERGNKLADDLENGIRQKESAPNVEKSSVKAAKQPRQSNAPKDPVKNEAEKELIKALRAVR